MIFGIMGNPYNREVPRAVYNFLSQMALSDAGFVVEKNLYSLLTRKFRAAFANSRAGAASKIIRGSDFIISFGGDGTFLSVARLVGNSQTAIIGVNLGKLGFLADISEEQAVSFVRNVINKKYTIERRTVLEASSPSVKKKLHGLNEIVIGRTASVKIIRIKTYYNNKFIMTFYSDGLIIATPTGTTAYSMSAGGPIVDPESQVIVLTPICAHSLTARPIVLPNSGKIRIEADSRVPIVATADGEQMLKLKRKAVINIRKASYTVNMVKSSDHNYYDVLNKKLLLGQDIRK